MEEGGIEISQEILVAASMGMRMEEEPGPPDPAFGTEPSDKEPSSSVNELQGTSDGFDSDTKTNATAVSMANETSSGKGKKTIAIILATLLMLVLAISLGFGSSTKKEDNSVSLTMAKEMTYEECIARMKKEDEYNPPIVPEPELYPTQFPMEEIAKSEETGEESVGYSNDYTDLVEVAVAGSNDGIGGDYGLTRRDLEGNTKATYSSEVSSAKIERSVSPHLTVHFNDNITLQERLSHPFKSLCLQYFKTSYS